MHSWYNEAMIYILYGKDEGRMRYKAQQIRNQNHLKTWTWVDAQNTDMNAGLMSADAISLFSEPTMTMVANATFLSSKNTTKWDLEKAVRHDGGDNILVYLVPAEKLDTRKKLVKQLMNSATVMACIPLDDKNIVSVIQEMMKEKQMSMSNQALEWFSARCTRDSMMLEQELEKLKTFSDHLELEDVKALATVEPEQDVFAMTEALFARNVPLLLDHYRSFRERKMTPLEINGLLASQVRFLYQVRVLSDQRFSQEEIADRLKVKKGRVWFSLKKATGHSSAQLLEWLKKLADLDVDLKILPDKDMIYEQFLISLLPENGRRY